MTAALKGLAMLLAAVALAVATARHYEPRILDPLPLAPLLTFERIDGRARVTLPKQVLIGVLGETYDDEIYAYLAFDYLRGSVALAGKEVFLYFEKVHHQPKYTVLVLLENDFIAAIPFLEGLRSSGLVSNYRWKFTDSGTLRTYRQQTTVFVRCYNFPISRKIESLKPGELARYLRRFVRFKSATDIRVRKGTDPVPEILTETAAERLASDILTVAGFYDLPLDLFLGIGAMENNYMDVRGDLGNTIWKRRPERGDIVLRRRKGRVLVLNESSGVWQITQETLRYVHRLYLKDERDYSELPEHLRPPRELRLENVTSELLTTYAGLLFRDLLDNFGGDVIKAVGAYNGGPGNPNLSYGERVVRIAAYARRILEQAASLHGQAVVELRFISPSP